MHLQTRQDEKYLSFRLAGSLSLFLFLFFTSVASAEIRQWDFENPEDYQFDQKKVKFQNGTASLNEVAPYRDAGSQSFQNGQFDLNTSVERGTLELAFRGPQEIAGPELPAPVGNREPGLAALWHADEPSGTNLLDSVGRTVAKASDTEVVAGQTGFGYARMFDGEKSFVFIPHYETLSLRGPFTLEAWIRPVQVRSVKPQTILSRWQTIGAQRGFALQVSPEGKLDFLVTTDGSTVTHQTGTTQLTDGMWYHVAAVYTGTDLRVYLNGVLDSAPLAFAGPVYASNNPIYIGGLVDNRVDQHFKGVIDEVGIYQKALGENETLTRFGNLQGLAAVWHLNERGGLLTDASGYGHNGTVSGNVAFEAEGRMGTALEFRERGAFMQAPASSRLAPNGQMTLEAWVKPASFPGLGQNATVLSIYEEASAGSPVQGGGEFSLALTGPEGRVAAYASRLQPAAVQGRITLTPNVWQHVAVTWGGGMVRIYTNGVLDTEAPYSGSLDYSRMALRIGADSKGASSYLGSVDEAAVFRRARTPQEISKSAGLFPSGGIYTSETKDAEGVSPWRSMNWKLPLEYGRANDGSEPGLLHIYHLDDAEGSGIENAKGEIKASPMGTHPVPGVFGNARWFAGKGYDKILSQKDFPSLSTFSISFWFQFASAQPGLNDRLVSIGDGNPTIFRGPDGHMRVQMQGAREIKGERVLGDSSWHHMTLTADGRTLFLYIDGLLDGNSPFMTATAESPLVLGNLKSTDTFQGAIDEFLFYNYPLTRDAIMQQFLRGQMDVKMLVRSSGTPDFAGAAWRGPQGARISEEPGMFTAGLWHFDEILYQGKPSELQDSSHFANHGTTFGKISRYPDAVFGTSAEFNGSSDFIRAADTDSLHMEKFTLSAWVRPEGMAEGQQTLFDKQFQAGAPVFSSFALDLNGGNRLSFRLGRPGGYRQIESGRDGEVAAGRWNHVAAVYDKKEVRLYINGKKVKTAEYTEPIPYDEGPLYFGRYGSSEARFFRGAIDEVHFQNTAADDQEILARYIQGNPENFFRPYENTAPNVEAARYFQYRLFLSTNQPFASPAVSEIDLIGTAYPADRPFIAPVNGVSYAEITNFNEKKGANNAGTVTYQVSPDGANWFFHNGRHWVAAAGANESNPAEQIRNRVSSFAKEVGIGSFYFRAFLQSPTGTEPAELDNVEVEYLPNKLTVTAPNGGEALLAGTKQIIGWNTAGGEMKKVNIEYSKDGFKNDFHRIAKGVDNTGSFEWTVPDDPSVDAKIRVMDSLDPRVYDTSDLSFRLTGKIDVISPNWNERWEAGSTQKIVWKTQGKIPQVKIEFSTDGFEKSIYSIVDSVKNNGDYLWTIPDHLSNNVRVRVSDVRDAAVNDVSNDSFAITGQLTVVSPQAGARWIAGSDQEIRWQSNGTIPLVHIEYQTSKNPEWIRIAENFESRGSFMWKVPDDIDGSVKVRVMDSNDLKLISEAGPFSINGGLRLLNPKGGEQWTAGTRRKIAWETVGTIPVVNLEYRTSENGEWQTIEESLANTGTYVWQVPSNIDGPLTVRVADPRDPMVEAVHASASSVVPGFDVKIPDGGEEWKIGTEQNILWETVGDAQQVKLEYSKDGFRSDIREIIASASNLGSYTWTVPDDAGLGVQIRVSDVRNATAHSISNAPFRIYGGFDIEIPKGGEKFEVGSMATFVWKTLGTVPNVRIEYSHDDFRKDSRLIEAFAPNEGKYTWTVPDDIGEGYQLRISDARDPKTEAYSHAPFSVIGNFHLIYPVGGEDLIAGTIARIAWRGAGSVPVVRIDYSEDDFQKSFSTVTDKAPNSGSYEWEVPNLIGRQFKIRIWDPSQPDSMDVMDQPARIVGGFRLLEPNGGEILYVGDKVSVSWETSGTLPRVKFELSSDNFTKDISVVTDSYPNNGVYEWLVPDAPSGKYKLRVSDPRDVTAFDISNADFTIRSRFVLQSPNGGEGWTVGEKQTIRWQTSAAVSQVRLDFSTDGFQSASIIGNSVPNSGLYEWTVPDRVSQNAAVRVADVKDSEAFDVSDSPFRIQGVFTVTSPNGAEVWKTGEQRAITWKTVGQVEGVRLEYSRDSFSSEAKVIVEATPNAGHYNWTVPDDISSQAKIRVSDVKDPEAQDMSDLPFEIVGSFVMLAPNGGESWHASEKREITWMTVGSVKDVSLDYSADDFKTATSIEAGIMNTGRYTWDIPNILGENYKIRVCQADNPRGCDLSDNIFAIRSPIELTSPSGGEKWVVGTDQEIRWNSYGTVRRVVVSYSVNGGEWKKLIEEVQNEGHLLFRVPDNISNNVIVKVADYDDETLFAISRAPLTILGSFELLSPNGGEKLAAGTMQKISWNNLGAVSNARLEFSMDDFKNDISLIEASHPNTGSYEWTVPGVTGVTARVRISDASHPEAFDLSDGVFKIMPGITVLSPNGGEVWVAGKKQKIAWKTAGKADWVRLEYKSQAPAQPLVYGPHFPGEQKSLDAETAWTLIADKVPNGGEYEWELPKQNGAEFTVRVTDSLDQDATDVSDAFFEIKPELILNHPAGKENLLVGSTAEILWDTVGTVPFVKVEYSIDNFDRDIRPVTDSVPNEGKLLWTVPDSISDHVKIRITAAEDALVRSVSPEAFKILPSFEVITPSGLEKWTVGTEETIKWNWTGTLDTVKLEYSIDDFRNAEMIIPAAPNKGFFIWTVPDAAHAMAKIRVSDPRFPEANALSQAFKVIPGFKITVPNGGERLAAGDRKKIEWQTAGVSSKVKLEYGVQSGDVRIWKTIESVMRNSGHYEWRVPADLASDVKIRISDALDSAASDESDETFKILGVLKILAPRGEEVLTVDSRTQLRWETEGKIPSVKIEYGSDPEKPFQPVENLWGNTGNYFWTVPDAASEKVWLKISDATEPETFAVSEAPFKIRGVLAWDMPAEAGGLNWPVGSMQTLKWKTTGSVPKINLEYTTDQKNWKTIASGVNNGGSYGWTVPDDTAQGVKLRITNADLPVVTDTTEQPVSIIAQFRFESPAAADVWTVGSTRRIQWKTTGRVQKVWLEYMTDGKKWQSLAGPMPDSGSYEWTVPDRISSGVKVRIFDGDNTKAASESGPFRITGTLKLNAPAGSEVWEVGSKHRLEWKTTGSISHVRLEAFEETANAPAAPSALVIADSLDNKGFFEWTVPDRISDRLKIRVVDVNDPSVYSVTPEFFSVIAHFEMKDPKQGDIWTVGSDHELIWSSTGTVPTVLLEYSRDGFYRELNTIASGVPNTGAALWTVPDSIGDQVKVRVSDPNDARAAGVSESFKIRGAFAFAAPETGAVWQVGSRQRVEWRTMGTIPAVRLEYSRDDFRKDVQVISNVSENQGGVEWTVPDIISNTVKLRIVDQRDAAVSAVSNPFKVEGVLALKSPLGGEKFQVLSTQKIAWSTTGGIPKVRLEYSKDDFQKDIKLISADLKNEGSYDWVVPDDVSDTLKVRVADAGDFSVSSSSPAPFAVRGSLLLTTQTEGVRWLAGSSQDITWQTVGMVPAVHVEYSKDDFQNDVQIIAQDLANRGRFVWTVADDISSTVRVRVRDAAHDDVLSVSSGPGAIVGGLEWTSVNAGTVGVVGEPLSLKWNTQGTVPILRLEYAEGDVAGTAAQDWKLVAGSLENTNGFNWTVPDFITGRAVVRISDVRDAMTAAVSTPFRINGKFQVVSPAGGERWIAGTTHDVTWGTSGTVPFVRLQYSTDGFSKDIREMAKEAVANTGRFGWMIPDAVSNTIQVRVVDARMADVTASSAAFSITGDLAFIDPQGDAIWQSGNFQKIKWQTAGTVPFVRIEYFPIEPAASIAYGPMPFGVAPVEQSESVSRQAVVIAARAENTGEFVWKIPADIPARVQVRVSNADDALVSGETVTPVRVLGLFEWTSPLPGEIWSVGTRHELLWKSQGEVSNALLEYSRDRFVSDVHTIATVPDNGSFQWEVPDAIAPEVWLRVSDAADTRAFAVSKPVKIRGVLHTMQPESGRFFEVDSTGRLEWQAAGTIPEVLLEYSTDDFRSDVRLIAAAAANQGFYDWKIPDAVSDNVKFRVSDMRDPSVSAVSAPFKIQGVLKLKSPAGGERYEVASLQKVLWETTGTIGEVRLDYSKDDFVRDIHPVADRVPNKGVYDWTIPDEVGDQIKIRVSDSRDSRVFSASPAPFSIRGALTLTVSTDGVRWPVNSKRDITWRTTGTVPFVDLQYSKDDFQSDVRTIGERIPNHGTFAWTVPDDISGRVRFRVHDSEYGDVISVSDALSITGALEWPPFEGRIFKVGNTEILGWKTTGTVPTVRLEYSEAANPGWKLIAGSIENTGEFSWVIPDFITDRAVLRVLDTRDEATQAVSAVFPITGQLAMVQPAGGERWVAGTQQDLVWNTSGSIADVQLEYSTDGFKNDIRPLTSSPITNNGRYSWTVPDSISERVQVRVRDAGSPEVADESAVFTVLGDLSFTVPAGAGAWQVGEVRKIEWTTSGTVPFVTLEYFSADGNGETGGVIARRIENKGSFEWVVPAEVPAKIRLRVANADDSSVFEETPESIRILGVLNFTAPAEKQSWTVGSTQDIVWNTLGYVPNVKLEFSRDGFQNDVQTIYPVIPNNGSVQWQIPDVITQELRLRVSDADNPKVFTITSLPVSVHGALEVTAPIDGAPVEVGQKQEIAWQTLGTIPSVTLEYSADNFTATRAQIAENVSNTGRYTWQIPDAAREKLTVRVMDASNNRVLSVSRPFMVHGRVELVTPRGGEIWKVDDHASIKWKTVGNVSSVKIEYSADEFITSNLIAGRAENRGDFVWRVPASVNQPVKIRISDADDASVFSVTPTALKVQGVLSFLAPQGGEFWTSGTEQPVIWQVRGSMPYVTLEYSTDNFQTAIPVMLGFANEGRLKWTVPDVAADAVKFRISDARDQSVSAVSGPVRVGGRLELLSPSGDLLRVGETVTVKWKNTGMIPKVRLEFSGDGFKKDIRMLQDSVDNAGAQGSYEWKVPDMITKDLQVRVTDIKHPDIYDVSEVPFKIAGALKLTKPQAGDSWPVASRQTVEWDTTGTVPFVRIEYSKDNFISSVPVELRLRNTGKLDWTVPDFSGDEIQFRVSDAEDPAVSDASAFRVAIHGVLSMTSPLGDEVWTAKSEHPITWNTIGTIPNVSLEYVSALSNQPVRIADSIANTGSYVWTVPDRSLRGVKVRVSDSASPYIFSESPELEIRGTLNLTSPQGGEVWIAGTQHQILWTSSGSIEKVRLEYSVDSFNTVVPVTLALANEGKYQWRVPDAISRNVQVRLSDASQSAVVSESQAFEIRGALTLINPVGGEEWAVATRHPVSWETTGTIPQVRLEYSSDDFRTDIQTISPAIPNKGVFYWDIPSIKASQLKVRVMDTANADVFDISRNPVRISGGLDLISPANGESYHVGEKIQIRWRSTPNIVNVKLEFSTDDFKTVTLISHYVPNNGVFDWNIPDRLSDNVRVRISDAANAIVAASSRVPFKIQGALEFTSPRLDETWAVGSRQRLKWNTLGGISKVRIEYSADEFKTSVPVATGIENQGSFDWDVPEIGSDIRLRISDASAPSVQNVTRGRIHVIGSLELVTPAGGERWIVGEERVIRWRILGMMPKVDIEYSKDGFKKDVHLIAAEVPNLGSYSWKIPNDPAKEVRIRVRNSSDNKIFTVSGAPFKIDFNQVAWTVRDTRTGEHLLGLTLTDSSGKTRSNLSSPVILEYPYGIYTTVWSKPGYGEFNSTWLADKDMNFTVALTPEEKALENVRFDFRYDRERDLMSIKSWHEQDGVPVPAVVQSEVKIYQGTELIKTLISTTPDENGYFHMVWDTHQVAGNARYVASASITTAAGRTHASPVSYQLDIPVKEFKEPVARQSVSSVYLKPLALPASAPVQQAVSPVAPVPAAVEPESAVVASQSGFEAAPIDSEDQPAAPAPKAVDGEVQAPKEAVLNETVSISYTGDFQARPVLDLYDSNRRLILRAQRMESQGDGRFTYLLPVRGNAFVPGKAVTATVVDLSAQQFKSVSIMIKSSTAALGLDHQAGLLSAQELVAALNQLITEVQQFQRNRANWEDSLSRIERRLTDLAGALTQPSLPPAVFEKLNTLSQVMGQVLSGKGYDPTFLTETPLPEAPSQQQVDSQIRLLQDATKMMRRLYQSAVGR